MNTATAHGLKVGYQAQLQGNGSLTVGTAITSIVINNEDNAGLATVTTSTAHGLAPMEDVTITGVQPSLVGAASGWSALWNGTNVTLTLGSGVHGLVPGAVVSVTDSGTPTSIFVGSFTVNTVPAPNQISYDQFSSSLGTSSVTATGLSVSITWPVPDDTMMPTYFEVQACPTPTTFQVQVTYCDGTWSSGTVGFPWDGTFYVTQIPSATSFICQNEGPSGVTTEVTGTVTPFGQLGAWSTSCRYVRNHAAGCDNRTGAIFYVHFQRWAISKCDKHSTRPIKLGWAHPDFHRRTAGRSGRVAAILLYPRHSDA